MPKPSHVSYLGSTHPTFSKLNILFIMRFIIGTRSSHKLFFFLSCLCINASRVNAQTANVSVNLPTGTAYISIPVHVVSRGAVVPISLEYAATGIHIGELESMIGIGWHLNAGGQITRELRDLPDDIKTDLNNNSRMGWMFNSNATKINSFTISNDNNTSTCTDETTDINYINTNFSDNSDMEPDIFNVQAPGLSCQLIYDRINNIFRTIPYKDIQVSYTLNASGSNITSFKILNDKGIEYTFDVVETITQTTSFQNTVNYFKRDYNLYQYGVVYNSNWYLSQIKDAEGNIIKLTYNNGITRSFVTPTTVSVAGVSSVLYNTTQTYTPKRITSIASYDATFAVDNVSFSYTSTTDPVGSLISTINQNGRIFSFTYQKVPGLTKDYLTSFGEAGCTSGGINYNSNLYKFDYNNITFAANSPGIYDLNKDGTNQDYWGYPNGNYDNPGTLLYIYPDNASYPNLERYRISPVPGYSGTFYTISSSVTTKVVDPTTVGLGVLNKITYPGGGTTTLVYEPNDYYDVSAGNTAQGGGVRIKQTIDYDGINTANNITHNYTYTDPSTGVTTGKPISLPIIAFTIPYTGTATGFNYWNNSTAILQTDNSANDLTILYGKVTVQQTGTGKIVHEYVIPATFWDANAGTDWTPTIVKTGRIGSGTCPGIGSLKNDKNTYPFIPDINYDFERALPTKATIYNESGKIVSQSTYTYQRSYTTPIKITALKFDDNLTAKAYGKYQVFTTTSELIVSEVKLLNDLGNTTDDPTKRVTSSTNFYYLGTNHKLPTKIETNNTDGTVNRSYIKYTKDYTYGVNDIPDQTVTAVKAMVNNLNINTPVETYNTVVRSGVEKTISAVLTKFNSFPSGTTSPPSIYLPGQQLQFLSSAGVTNFTPSNNSGGSFINYSGYIPVANYLAYDYSGALLSADDNYNNVKSQLIDNNTLLPIATITNAKYNEVAYSNFDGLNERYAGFTQTNCTTNTLESHTGHNSLSVPVNGLLQAAINLKPGTKNYVFSCWVNAAAAGNLTVSLYNSGGSLFSTKTISFPASGTGWNYYEQKVNTNGITSSFTIKVQTNAAIDIDDVLAYPESSEVNTSAYDKWFFSKTAETNTNGVSQYYSYDGYNRLQYVYDQDKNIILKRTYEGPGGIAAGLVSASFTTSPATGIKAGSPVTFTGSSGNACIVGTLYSWDFGDGTPATSPSLTNSQAHTYTTAGTYTVTLTASNGIYGTTTYNQSVVVGMNVIACLSGVWAYVAPTVYTGTCPPNPSDNTHSYFTITSTGAPVGHTLSYQWQIAYTATGANCGSASWTNTGTNSNQFVKSFSASTFCPYNIRCIVTDTNNGQTATSGTLAVQNNLQ